MHLHSILICASISISLLLTVQCLQPVVRQTVNGPIQGFEMKTILGKKCYTFVSIPYAKPPITGQDPYTGEMVDRRFKAPEMLDRNWTNPLKLGIKGKQCFQGEKNLTEISEDCLILNVYEPADGAKRKTVLVFIHGGSFSYGGGTVGADFLASQDNIVVNIQYRVGIFGFLNLGFGEYTGNMGLKDQQLALKWVYENIEYFSGNKDEILLMGQSAGAASVHYHMLNEQSQKYFKRAFLISSSAFSFYALLKENHIHKLQNCSHIHKMSKMIEYIKTTDAAKLLKCYSYKFPGKLDPVWVPTIESKKTEGAFMTKTPEEIYRSGKVPPIDTMFSFTTQEMLAFFPRLLRIEEPLLNEDLTKINETIFQLPFEGITRFTHPKLYKDAVEKLRASYYLNTTSVEAIRSSNVALMSDMSINYGILRAVIYQTEVNTIGADKSQYRNTFLFRFSVNTELKNYDYLAKQKYVGATHGDDLPYIFQIITPRKIEIYKKSLLTKDHIYEKSMRMATMITNFARKGDPSIDGDTRFKRCLLPDIIFCQEISDSPRTRVINGIKEILHYFVWHNIENAALHSTGNKADRPSQGFLLNIFIIMCIYLYIFPNIRNSFIL